MSGSHPSPHHGRDRRKLVAIKTVHTIIWLGVNACFVLMVWSGVSGRFDATFWIPAGLIGAEILVLLVNRMTCPLTPLAARYTGDRRDNFDIYLPLWLARYNKAIYSVILVAGLIAIAAANA